MNSTSESSSRAWRLIVGVLPIGLRRLMARSSTLCNLQKASAVSTVPSSLPSSTSTMERGRSVCRITEARHNTIFSASLKAGMITSTVVVRQSSAGVGTSLSAPRISPRRLRMVFGLRTK